MIHIKENFELGIPKFSEADTQRVTEALLPGGGSYGLEVTFAAIHEGLTRNNTFYSKDGLTNKEKNDQGQIGGLESWTKPYPAPILKDHEAVADNQIGRVIKAEWLDKAGSEKGHVQITALITNPEAIQKFMRGEYQTGSIGMDVDKAECSICGVNLKEDFWGCSHERGAWYKKAPKGDEKEGEWLKVEPHESGARRAHINIGNVWAREYSVVGVPSDAHSRVKTMKQVEIKSAMLKGEGVESIVLGSVNESVENPTSETVLDEVDEPGRPAFSVAEMVHEFREDMESDLLSFYAELCSAIVANSVGSFALLREDEELPMSIDEAQSLVGYIEANNEDVEAELKEIAEAVLSTSNGTSLPDSAFALVKTVEGKTVRTLRYKMESGQIDASNLRTSLSRWSQVEGFAESEKAKAFRKLRAAAIKAGFGGETTEMPADELAAEIDQAKEFLAKHGFERVLALSQEELNWFGKLTPEEFASIKAGQPADTKDLKEKLEASEAALVDANMVIIEREAEAEELLDQIEELKTATQTEAERREIAKTIVAMIEADEERSTEVQASEDPIAAAIELAKDHMKGLQEQITVTAPVSKTGLALGSEKDELSAEVPQLTAETMIGAFLGSRRAKAQLFAETDKLK
jgi:hypothetical protein